MLGAVVGDVVGSRFEWNNYKSKDFSFLADRCRFTDDSVMTIAVAEAILECEGDYRELGMKTVASMRRYGRKYPRAGYGGSFLRWVASQDPQPYNSWGNGAAMRVSACGFAAESVEEAIRLSRQVTEVTHNHPEGLKGAEAVAVAIFLARSGWTIAQIREYITKSYYRIDFTLDEIRETYRFDVSCQGSVPQALEAFFESVSFEDAIRNAVSIGGDSDTIAAIAGSVAEAYYGIPEDIRCEITSYLRDDLREVIQKFELRYPG